jgi:Domain of unknown function (DUF4145)
MIYPINISPASLASLQLILDICPHCGVAAPVLTSVYNFPTTSHRQAKIKYWRIYACTSCGNVVPAWAHAEAGRLEGYFPRSQAISADIPQRPRAYLAQCKASLHAPSGAVMLAASAIDAMLKHHGLEKDSLAARLTSAAQSHLITSEMADWGHDVRLDANDERHADKDASLPTEEDAKRCFEFATALAEFLFVLPARVRRGRAAQGASGS